MPVPYTAEKDDLYYPAEHAEFFPNGRPGSDAALCAEMARLAYVQLDNSFALDRSRISKVLTRIGFAPQSFRFFEVDTDPNCHGSHGFLAADGASATAVLSFRGTDKDDPTDLMDDADVLPENWQAGGRVHSGFARALMAIWDPIEEALKDLGDRRLLFTGHSLGAAMATLAATLRPPAALYTIGSPRVGDPEFAALLARLENFRFVDCCDLVTRVPPQTFGYAHIPGDILYIDADRAIQKLDPNDPAIGADRTKAEEAYLVQYAWRIGDVGLRPLADHAPANYVWPVSAAMP
jgi:pimeloyl-ACP methyl ester carboxylesterase